MERVKYIAEFIKDVRARKYRVPPEDVECLCDFVIGCLQDITDYKQRMNCILRDALGIDEQEREIRDLREAILKELS